MSDSPIPAPSSPGSSMCSVIIRADAQAAMDRHMSDDTAIEYGGVLVGTADPLIGLVIVTGHEPLPDSDTAETVTFTRETWDQMTRHVMARHPGQRIVGWYHSHPRFGIFLSAHDLAIQTTYFSQPWQIAYVFDPVQHERGLFGWANYEIVRIPAWEVATGVAGIATSAPAHVPAHGEYISTRLADEAAAAAQAASNPPAVLSGPPVIGDAPVGPPVQPKTPRRGRAKLVVLALVVVAIGAAVAILLDRRSDDSGSAATTTAAPITTDATTISESTVPTSTTTAPETTTAPTDAATSTSADTADETSTTETATSLAAGMATPAVVTAPSGRVAAGTLPCEAASDGAFTPAGNCYVPLNNGNVLSYVSGSLTCADPAGTILATASSFTVGVPNDPLAVVADGTLVPKCGDLTYAKNILAGGAATLDGLCGGHGTAIDDGSLRCFAQNPTTGAMTALLSGENGSIVGSCTNGSTPATATPLTWTKSGVDVSWRIVSLVYDADQNAFTASATRDGVPTTATFSCA